MLDALARCARSTLAPALGSLALGVGLAACGATPASGEPSPAREGPSVTATSAPSSDATAPSSTSPAAAARVVDVDVDVDGTGLTRHALAGLLGVWSGPPGGPLGLSIEAFDDDDGALEKRVRARLGAAIEGLETTRVTVAGQDRVAVAFTTGQSHARSEHCAFAVRKAGASGPGVLVTALVGLGRGPADCARIVSHPALAKALGSLRLR